MHLTSFTSPPHTIHTSIKSLCKAWCATVRFHRSGSAKSLAKEHHLDVNVAPQWDSGTQKGMIPLPLTYVRQLQECQVMSHRNLLHKTGKCMQMHEVKCRLNGPKRRLGHILQQQSSHSEAPHDIHFDLSLICLQSHTSVIAHD